MFMMFADETNLDPTDRVRFFIYGGLIIEDAELGSLSDVVSDIRDDHGFEPADPLKFRTQSRPGHVDPDDWTEAKSEVIEAAREHNAWFIACLVLHQIARNNRDRLIDWQLNSVLDRFSNDFLDEMDDVGLVTLDRIGNQREYALMRSKFTEGGETPWGAPRLFPRIVGLSASSDGASHLSSVADVVLGTFAYCVNQRGDLSTPRRLFPAIEPMIWRRRVGRKVRAWGHGLVLSPARVVQPTYRNEYEQLKRHIRALAR